MSELDKKIKEIFDETMLNGAFSLIWVMKNILGLSESEIKELLKNKTI